jgi:hypothetical protein
LNGNYGLKIKHEDQYFRPGLSYGKRTDALNVSVMPLGCVFSHEGQAVFPVELKEDWLLCLAYLNSRPMRFCANQISGSHKLAGYVARLPFHPKFRSLLLGHRQGIETIVRLMRELATLAEQNREFILPVLLKSSAHPLSLTFRQYLLNRIAGEVEALRSELEVTQTLEQELARQQSLELVKRAMGLHPAELAGDAPRLSADEVADALEDDSRAPFYVERIARRYGCSLAAASTVMEAVLPAKSPTLARETAKAVSYALGCVVGRWDIRYATAEQAAPVSPDPFAPLPVCPPGQLQNALGLPAGPEDVPATYPVKNIPWDGIVVDDPNHPLDIERRVREVMEIIWTGKEGCPTAEAIEVEACEILGVKTLRDYFRKPANFFADHLKRYSKSRRQAPIYWPLSTKSGSYTLWIYYHRLNDQTLHKCLADFLDPKIKDVESELGKLTGKDSGRAADLRDFLNELKDLKDDIERVIKLPWKPNLNDGVLITASPLWKLFRLSKWQKDLKACWEELEKGDYDWAHLAYTIWPERVEKVCEKDRSIAIAHGLEHLCKIEPPKPKKPRGKKASS